MPKAPAQTGLGLHSKANVQDDFVASDNESAYNMSEDQSDAGVELMRDIGTSRAMRKRQLGPPIETDEKIETLSPLHQMVLVEFMHDAMDLSRKVVRQNIRLCTLLPTIHNAHNR